MTQNESNINEDIDQFLGNIEPKKRKYSDAEYALLDKIIEYTNSQKGNEDILETVGKLKNSDTLNRIMLKAASRINWLIKHPNDDEAKK